MQAEEEDSAVFIAWADNAIIHTAMTMDSLATVNLVLVQGRRICSLICYRFE